MYALNVFNQYSANTMALPLWTNTGAATQKNSYGSPKFHHPCDVESGLIAAGTRVVQSSVDRIKETFRTPLNAIIRRILGRTGDKQGALALSADPWGAVRNHAERILSRKSTNRITNASAAKKASKTAKPKAKLALNCDCDGKENSNDENQLMALGAKKFASYNKSINGRRSATGSKRAPLSLLPR